jgi:hypothetical protein
MKINGESGINEMVAASAYRRRSGGIHQREMA